MSRSPAPGGTSGDFRARIEACRAGSKSSLGLLFDQYRNYLLLVANGELDAQLRAKCGPSDLVQDTFVQAQRCFVDFRGATEGELRGWLTRILLNRCCNVRTAFLDTSKRELGRETSLDAAGSTGPAAQEPAADSQTPSGYALANEEALLVSLALEKLSPEHQAAIRLRNWENQSFEEIGRQMGRSADAARKLWLRAIKRLGQEWEPRDGQP